MTTQTRTFSIKDWDPLEVLASFDRTIDEDMASDDNLVLLAFEEFIQDISQIFRDVCKANFVQLQVNHQDVFQFNGKHGKLCITVKKLNRCR